MNSLYALILYQLFLYLVFHVYLCNDNVLTKHPDPHSIMLPNRSIIFIKGYEAHITHHKWHLSVNSMTAHTTLEYYYLINLSQEFWMPNFLDNPLSWQELQQIPNDIFGSNSREPIGYHFEVTIS